MSNDNMIHAYIPRPNPIIPSSAASNVYDTNKIATQSVQLGPIAVADFPYVSRFREITKEMADLYAKKNADYGNSFAKSIDEFGLVAGLVRLSDKWNRVCELVKKDGNHQVTNESLKDTAIDGACYFIMLAMEVERLSHPTVSIDTIEFGEAIPRSLSNNNDSITHTPQITC